MQPPSTHSTFLYGTGVNAIGIDADAPRGERDPCIGFRFA
jgi:hypothetical protein